MHTIADLVEQDHELTAHCLPCGKYHVKIDFDALIRDGRGDLPYMRVRTRRTKCGKLSRMTLIAPQPFTKKWQERWG